MPTRDTRTPAPYALPLHDALPISAPGRAAAHDAGYLGGGRPEPARGLVGRDFGNPRRVPGGRRHHRVGVRLQRSEEHTSELQSHVNLVCRLLLEKKNVAV